jgi:hypothetical protein
MSKPKGRYRNSSQGIFAFPLAPGGLFLIRDSPFIKKTRGRKLPKPGLGFG